MRVPSVDRQVPSPVPMQAPGVEPMQDQTGKQVAMLGRGMEALGTATLNAGIKWQEEIDSARLKENDNLWADAIRQNVTEYQSRLGGDAVDSREAYEERLKTARQGIEERLDNERQREMFKAAADSRQISAMAEIDGHAAKQLKAQQFGQSSARMKGAREDAARTYDKGGLLAYRDLMVREANSQATLRGWGPDDPQRQQLVLDETTKLHETVLHQIVRTRSGEEAKAYLNHWRGEITAEAQEGLQNLVDRKGDEDVGATVAIQLQAAGGNLHDQVDEINRRFLAKELTGDQRKVALGNLQAYDQMKHTVDTRERLSAIQDAQTWRQQNPVGRVDPMQIGPPRPLPAELEARLDRFGGRATFDAWVADGGEWTTKPEGRRALLTWGDDHLRSFKTDEALIEALRPVLNDEDLLRMRKRRQEALTPAARDRLSESERSKITQKQALDFGVLPTKLVKDYTAEEAETALRWDLALDKAVEGITQGKRNATEADYQAAAASLSKETFNTGDGAKQMLATARPSQLADGTWDTPAGQVTAAAVNEVRKDVLATFAARGVAESRITESAIAHQAKFLIDQRKASSEVAIQASASMRQAAERSLTSLYRQALTDPSTGGSRRVAADKVAAVWGTNFEQMGMGAEDVQRFLNAQAGEPERVEGSPDTDLLWQAEVRRRKDAYGDLRWRNKLQPESWERWQFLSSEAARQDGAKNAPGDPTFFYDNWHALDSSLTNQPIQSRQQAARENPYLNPTYKSKSLSPEALDRILKDASK